MRFSITEIDVSMDVGDRGVDLDVRDSENKHLGTLYIGRVTIEWCSGRTQKGNGVQKTWEELIGFFK